MDVFFTGNNEEKKRICCIRPKTWTRVVGVLELSICGLVALGTIILFEMFVQGSTTVKDPQGEDSRPTEMKEEINGINLRILLGEAAAKVGAFNATAAFGSFVALVSPVILLLLIGNEKERPGFFLPWFILNWIFLALIVVGITGFIFNEKSEGILGILPEVGISGFFLYVVHRRFQEIKTKRRSRRTQQQRAEVYKNSQQDDEI